MVLIGRDGSTKLDPEDIARIIKRTKIVGRERRLDLGGERVQDPLTRVDFAQIYDQKKKQDPSTTLESLYGFELFPEEGIASADPRYDYGLTPRRASQLTADLMSEYYEYGLQGYDQLVSHLENRARRIEDAITKMADAENEGASGGGDMRDEVEYLVRQYHGTMVALQKIQEMGTVPWEQMTSPQPSLDPYYGDLIMPEEIDPVQQAQPQQQMLGPAGEYLMFMRRNKR